VAAANVGTAWEDGNRHKPARSPSSRAKGGTGRRLLGAHEPDEARVRIVTHEGAERIGGVAGAELGLDGGGEMRGWRAMRRAEARRSASGAMPFAGFSGLPGETSHQTASRWRRSRAADGHGRWPPWAGMNEPPISPTVFGGRRAGGSRAALARPRAPDICRW
jgi:hypothetical protein